MGVLALQLDVEALVAALALGRQHVVAGEGTLEEVSVEGLKMVVPPCAAGLAVVGGPHLWCCVADHHCFSPMLYTLSCHVTECNLWFMLCKKIYILNTCHILHDWAGLKRYFKKKIWIHIKYNKMHKHINFKIHTTNGKIWFVSPSTVHSCCLQSLVYVM